ncbi:MAG: ABC transporter permease [Candidatus Sulfopaludibacter sp.]|nr:ABC transporter permease [Candidatus Sulfopaludibacter sp.]
MPFPWNRMEAELKRELDHHLNELTAEFERRGHSHQDAVRMARREFGGSEQVKESCRDQRRWAWMTGIRQDLALALRQMRRSPAFAATAVLTLALGIAANVIVFGVLQAMILQPVNVPRGDRVMMLSLSTSPFPFISYPEVRDVRDGNTLLSAVAAYTIDEFGLEAAGVTRPAWGYAVSGQYFELVAIRPFLGRLLRRADDDHPGASDAAVLSFQGWKNNFGADPNIVGKVIRLNKHPYTIVGVTPEGFYGTEKFLRPELFTPLANEASLGNGDWLEQRQSKQVFSVVRLKDGVTLPQARAELIAIAARVRRQYPNEEEGLGFKLARPGLVGDTIGGPARAFLAGVLFLAGIVLLAACANLGSLFAARTADRAREIAIRMAIGSSRWRILRQVLVEAILISILGGACSCGLAWVALTGLAAWRPPTDYPMAFTVQPQPSLILMTLAISVLAGVLFGMMPLRQIFKTDPNDAIKSGGSQRFAGRRWALRDCLLAAQIALCCVTVTAAFVSLRGLGKAFATDLGFQPRNAVLTRFDLSQAGYSDEAAAHFQRRLLESVSELPGVKAAGYANTTPLKGDHSATDVFSLQTTDFRPSNRAFVTNFFQVSPGYFAAAGTPLLAGRDVSFTDTAGSPAVAVVNQTFARLLFHSGDAVGRYFKTRSGGSVRIVGIVADGKYLTITEDQEAAAFYPISSKASKATALIVRPRGGAAAMAASVRRVVRDLDSSVPIRESSVWSSQLAMSFFPSQVATAALGLFGAFGLLLSIAGAFGLASYTVSKRLRELSIRVALGAPARQILTAALGRMILLLGTGSVVGIVLGMAASRLLSAIVYQASAQDPVVLAAVALTMMVTGSLSVAGPVRRALRIDPAILLREQ